MDVPGWDEVTAIGTLAVAAVTGALAWSTRRLAGASVREARANWQPVLLPIVDDDFADGRPGASLVDGVLSIGVRNVGRGPALLTTIALWDGDQEPADVERVYRGRAAADVVPPNETLVFECRKFEPPKSPDNLGLHAWAVMRGMVTYGDVGYVRYETELTVGFRIDGAVSLLSHRFLGARIDRISRADKIRHRALVAATSGDRGPGGGVRQRVRHRVARETVKRLG